MNDRSENATPSWLEFLAVSAGAVWFGAIGFFLGFLLSDGLGWLEMKRMGNVPDAPPPDFPQWLAWTVPCVAGLAAAWAGGRLGKLLVKKIGEVGGDRG